MGLLDGLKQLAAQVTGAQSTQGTQGASGSGQAEQAGSSSGSNSIFDSAETTDKQDVQNAANEFLEAWENLKETTGSFIKGEAEELLEGAKEELARHQQIREDMDEANRKAQEEAMQLIGEVV